LLHNDDAGNNSTTHDSRRALGADQLSLGSTVALQRAAALDEKSA
jgi:hypothetical protein